MAPLHVDTLTVQRLPLFLRFHIRLPHVTLIVLEAVSLDTNQEQTDFHFPSPLNGTEEDPELGSELLPPVSIVLPQQLLNEQLRKGRTVLNIAHLVVSNVDQFFPTTK